MREGALSEKKKWLASAALLLLLGGVGGVLFRARLSGLADGDAGASRSKGEVFGAKLSARGTQLWTRLLAALSLQGGRRFTFEALTRLLTRHRNDPVAKAFSEEFARDPELRAILGRHIKSRGVIDAERLARELSESKRFAELLNRYSDDPRFAEAAEAFTRGMSEEAISGGLAGVIGTQDLSRGDSRVMGAGSASRAGKGSLAAAARRGEGDGRSVAASGGQASEAGTQAAGAGGPGGQAGGGEHQILKLAQLKVSGPAVALNPWASLCFRDGGEITREQCSAINRHLGEDALWTACIKAGMLDKCVSLCHGNVELGCASQASELEQCRSRASATACAEACGRGDCRAASPHPSSPKEDQVASATTQDRPSNEGGSEPEPSSEVSSVSSPEPAPAITSASPNVGSQTLQVEAELLTSVAVPAQTAMQAVVAPSPPPAPKPTQPKKKKKPFGWFDDIAEAIDDFVEAVGDFFGF